MTTVLYNVVKDFGMIQIKAVEFVKSVPIMFVQKVRFSFKFSYSILFKFIMFKLYIYVSVH